MEEAESPARAFVLFFTEVSTIAIFWEDSCMIWPIHLRKAILTL